MSYTEVYLGKNAQIENAQITSAQPGNAFVDAYIFCTDTMAHPDARLRQTAVAVDGFFVGGLKEIPDQLTRHPAETAAKVLLAGTSGAVFGALIATGSPLLGGGALVCGGVLTGIGLANSWSRINSNGRLAEAMTQAWNNNDNATLGRSMSVAENQLGAEAFDIGLAALCTGSGAWGGKVAMESFLAKPRWHFSPSRVWVKEPDGSRTYENQHWGSKDTLFQDGTLKLERTGWTTTHHAHGPTIDQYSNGVEQTRFRNGTIETSHPDGRKITEDAFHNRSIELPNGMKIEQSPTHTKITRPDGTITTKQIDGYIYRTNPNGDSLTTSQDGTVSLYNKAEGKIYFTKPNGEKFVME